MNYGKKMRTYNKSGARNLFFSTPRLYAPTSLFIDGVLYFISGKRPLCNLSSAEYENESVIASARVKNTFFFARYRVAYSTN